MSFGTKGCMYNCGDECTGECMKVETKTKMSNIFNPHISLEEFLSKRNMTTKELVGDIPRLLYWTSVYCHEEKLNYRRQTMRIRKTIEAINKNKDE